MLILLIAIRIIICLHNIILKWRFNTFENLDIFHKFSITTKSKLQLYHFAEQRKH